MMEERTTIRSEMDFQSRNQEDTPMADKRPSYKSWKKKYRKKRIEFDHQMLQSEELHKLEQKAMSTSKRLAIENDRLLDILLDINSCPQVAAERRVDLSLEEEDKEGTVDGASKPGKSLRRLIDEVPHMSFQQTVELYPDTRHEILPDDPEIYPTSFLSADDIDTYLAELDMTLGLKTKPAIPKTPQPNAAPNTSAANFALRNPTSVYNWLRKHAPKTFLQDADKEKDHEHGNGEKGEGSKKKAGGSRNNKKPSSTSRKEAAAPEQTEWDDEAGHDVANKAPGAGSAKGKRKRDEDPGYRPKGGSSRPSKRKRQSKDLSSSAKVTKKSSSG